MSDRWELRIESDNSGKPLKVWAWDEYELCQNVNLGSEGGWVFELTFRGRYLSLAPLLADGKKAASEHQASLHRSAESASPLEVAS